MSIDQRARNAAAAVRDGLVRIPLPGGDIAVRHLRRRRRVARSLTATVLIAVASIGALAVVANRDDPAPLKVTGGPDPELPDGAVVAGRWTVVPKQSAGLTAASSLSAVASTGRSFLLAGSAAANDGWAATIWRSEDGFHWQPAAHPRADGVMLAIAAAGNTALAVGTDGGPLGGGGSIVVWRSNDGGRNWSDVTHGSDVFGPPAPETARPFVHGLLYQDGWWIAYGGASTGHAGVWVSRDGERWTQTLDPREVGRATVVTSADGGLFAYSTRRGWFASEPDSWGEPVHLATPDGFAISAVADGSSLAVGASDERHSNTLLMRSADGGRSWTTDETFSRQFPDAWLLAAARTNRTLIASGASGESRPAAWISSDGDSWSALPLELAGSPGGTLSLIDSVGDTTVILGTAPELDRYYVHRGP